MDNLDGRDGRRALGRAGRGGTAHPADPGPGVGADRGAAEAGARGTGAHRRTAAGRGGRPAGANHRSCDPLSGGPGHRRARAHDGAGRSGHLAGADPGRGRGRGAGRGVRRAVPGEGLLHRLLPPLRGPDPHGRRGEDRRCTTDDIEIPLSRPSSRTPRWCAAASKCDATVPSQGRGDRPRRRSACALLLAAVDGAGRSTLEQIWLTHAHIDHAGGTGTLARTLGLPIIGPHPGDQFWIDGWPAGRHVRLPAGRAFTPTAGWPTATRCGGRLHARRAPLPGPHAGPRGVPQRRRRSAPSSATCCSPAASAAPTSPAATSTP
jgi:hypothetical protein